MKIHNNRDSGWYGYENLASLLEFYAPKVQTLMPATASGGLEKQLNQIIEDGQYFISININSLSQNFENGETTLRNNHWAGFYMVKSFGQITGVIYIDPMGKKINSEISTTVTNQLQIDTIDEPLLGRPVQYVQLDVSGSFIEEGNYDDCGAFLVYCVASIVSGKKIRQDIKTPEQAISFGQYLRDVFERRASFDDIYKTITSDSRKGSLDNVMTTTATTTQPARKNDPKASKIQLPKDEKALAESITELEKKLFPWFHIDVSPLPNPEEERSKTLEEIREAHTKALRFFQENDFKNAEQELIKVLRPVLSKPEMKALYVDVKDVLGETLSVMYHLGLIYLKESNYFNNHAKAAAIFQYCAEFSKKYKVSLKLDNSITGNQKYFIKQAHLVENNFCQDTQAIEVDSDFNLDDTIAKSGQYKEELQQFRNTIAQELESINDLGIEQIEVRAGEVKNIYNNCTHFFVNHTLTQNNSEPQDPGQNLGLVQKLLKDCYEQLGRVSEGCEYAIVGLGSLSLGTMNPWSDLEFAVLINKDEPSYRDYFRNLTKLLWIKVINLQETPLSALGVEALNNYSTGEKKDNWFNDNLTQKAFRFDPVYEDACKSPLGRKGNYKVTEKVKDEETGLETETTITKPDYELIFTPEQMLIYQREEVQFPEECGNIKNWFEADRHLSQALQSVSLIDGSKELLKEYRIKLKEFRSNNLELHKSRALELLNEDVIKFSLKLGDEEEGKLLDAKQTIYRLGDRIVSALASYYGITAEGGEPAITVWQIIDEMRDEGILSYEGAKHLSEAISIATELRIRTYSHNQGRYDNMSTYEPVITDQLTEEQRKELIGHTFHFKDIEVLKHFYYVMLKVQVLVKAFYNPSYSEIAGLMLELDDLFDASNYNKGMVNARFLEYDKALKYLEAAKEEEPGDALLLRDLYSLYFKTGRIKKTIEIAEEQLSLAQNVPPKDSIDFFATANSYNNLGTGYLDKGEYEQALKYYKQALQMGRKIYENNFNHLVDKHIQLFIAKTYINLGKSYRHCGNYEFAIKYYNEALNIQLKAYEHNPNHPDIAMSYGTLGLVYENRGEYQKSIKFHTQALAIRVKAYENNPNHPDCY